jgi:Initiator Replication protein
VVYPLARLRLSKHESNDRLLDSLKRILRVVVTVPIPEPKTGEPAYLATHLFDFFTLPVADTDLQGTVRFGLPKKLQPILAGSNRWGRIKAEVVSATTSKYAIALETFPLARFRDLLGVPPGTYDRGNNFARFVIQPAMLEVNGLSDMSVDISLERRGKFAPIEAVTVTWWRKEGDEFRAVMQERDR